MIMTQHLAEIYVPNPLCVPSMVELKATRDIHKSTAVKSSNTDRDQTVDPKGKNPVLGYGKMPNSTLPVGPVVSTLMSPMKMYVKIITNMHEASRTCIPNKYTPRLRSDHSLWGGMGGIGEREIRTDTRTRCTHTQRHTRTIERERERISKNGRDTGYSLSSSAAAIEFPRLQEYALNIGVFAYFLLPILV